MKNLFKYKVINNIVIVVIFFTLLLGIFTAYQRIKFEKNYKSVEISLDYNEMENFSEKTDEDINQWLKKFSDLGVKSIAIQEETINTLIKDEKDIKVFLVNNLNEFINWEEDFPIELVNDIENNVINKSDVILSIKDDNLLNYIVEGLKLRYSKDIFTSYNKDKMGRNIIILRGTTKDILYENAKLAYDVDGNSVRVFKHAVDSKMLNIGIGYDEEKINNAKKSNLDIILRPLNYSRYPDKLVEAYNTENNKYNISPRLYLVCGKEVLGYPNVDNLENFLKDNDVSTILVESGNQRGNIEQKGLKDLVLSSNYNTIRGFTLWDWIRYKYKAYGYNGCEEIENSIYRAVTERNIRFVFFKPVYEKLNTYLVDEQEYDRMFNSLESRLSMHNMRLDKANSINYFNIGNFRLAILCLGVGLSCVMLFNKVFCLESLLAKLLYILSCGSFFAPFVFRDLSKSAFSLLAVICFASFAILYYVKQIRRLYNNKNELSLIKLIVKSAIILISSALISLIGAIFVVSILGDVNYMIEFNVFRGVKISQMFPFVVFILILVMYYMNNIKKHDSFIKTVRPIIDVLNAEIKVYYILIAGVLACIGYVYIARTGHETSVQPMQIELIIRNFLENTLIARPRTKEFTMAFPAIFVAAYAANKKIKFLPEIAMLIGVMGTSSIINTFCHIRTPLYLSIDRTFISIFFGIILGIIAIVILDCIYKIVIKIQEKIS